MWFWEVVFEDSKGCHSIFSLEGYPDQQSALQVFDANQIRIMQEVAEKEGKVLDVQIVYKQGDQLYE